MLCCWEDTGNREEDVTVKELLRREERKGDLYFLAFLPTLTRDIFQHIPSSFLEIHLLLIQIYFILFKNHHAKKSKGWQYFADCDFEGSSLKKFYEYYHSDSEVTKVQ